MPPAGALNIILVGEPEGRTLFPIRPFEMGKNLRDVGAFDVPECGKGGTPAGGVKESDTHTFFFFFALARQAGKNRY